MPYILDSDVVIYYLNESVDSERHVNRLMLEGIAISTITLMEVLAGISTSPDPSEAHARIEDLAHQIPVLPFAEPEARRCAALRRTLQRRGLRVRSRLLDLMIAATAIEHGLMQVTNDGSDYRGIPDLLIETP
ncbi:MAG: type II toxin-antitoxin system VapC family toxin [Thermomicrobiales bacterium]